ncbi:nitrilase-related carbon-nitrogen hydrolase [Pseudomonas sp. DTU_2021_1001937_2_SI_NGA_ILE_001]|uniref:nitrilase-related carbon-nitrogen hydrolase n=1 Tax=Pseudomonas sp. DTU_2021_1001937_2_SI_NGA_ILE_001 TaxID=3077589 RepID=UPI0028FC2257|nr:nitrilase-related carbon-nitrogen hydrolase [Pseudomonas sp. DTU_2021_1001937_2_SI_NGA_ILE_001]WNW14133.1 nitrilase-related carbon-nitrogen hydrolase [Pseudomonas sp. DTU_2021_1001937_2_SI_NGA_ILE_001]
MRKFFGLCLAALAVALLVSYGVWTTQRPMGHYLSDLRIRLAVSQGEAAGRGNLLGIETELYPTDYQDLGRLHRKLAAWLQQASDLGLVNDKTLVVLPEHIGTWLFAVGEKNQFYQAPSVDAAMDWLAWSNPLKFVTALLQARGEQRLDDAHLRMKADDMAAQYQQLFGGLAAEFGVTLVAGSIVLPEPTVEQGRLHTGSGPLYNVSLVFGANGKILGEPQRQLSPSVHQGGYIQPGGSAPLQVFDTPAGRLGVLIGSDSWQPGNYARLDASGAQLIAVPAFVPGRQRWEQAWEHHQGEDLQQPAHLSEGEAWQRLTLTGQAPRSHAKAGISVFMRGQFWDQGSSGNSFLHRQPAPAASPGGARLINLWL